ncbi:hypothetical protein Pan44_14840 [Caulifigura coniformis]|uniref:Uncharacterized protein n=1 Tax=Caulifigura coniformis TaxID=2527983 RepID=A0A517SBF0_9PLAN|nr:hypothetical protein [Caulifigura coniformis]QDT53467.1 hypothetical protein Pan44_14840 [Caulifigura coniformis]
MSLRKLTLPLFALLTMAFATPAEARPIYSAPMPVPLPGIAADGTLDFETLGSEGVGVYSVSLTRKGVIFEIEATGIVANLTGKKFTSKDYLDFMGGSEVPPEPGEMDIKKFKYTVTKNGKATLKASFTTDVFPMP